MNTLIKKEIVDIVFTGKNKEYGAYVLRTSYSKNLTEALIISFSVFVLSLSIPLIKNSLSKISYHSEGKRGVIEINDIGIKPNEKTPEKINLPEKQIDKSLIKTVKFVPPVIAPDNMVNEADELVSVDILKNNDPGRITQKGDFGNMPDGVSLNPITEVTKTPVNDVVETPEVNKIPTWLEEMPAFPGGEEALLKYIADNLKYPEIAIKVGVEGKVITEFVIAKDGSVSNVKVIKGIGAGCEDEAIRVIKNMPNWKPGYQNGVPTAVKISIPIVFRLN